MLISKPGLRQKAGLCHLPDDSLLSGSKKTGSACRSESKLTFGLVNLSAELLPLLSNDPEHHGPEGESTR
ncbi:MAG: hypothetical protein KDA91_03845 [Planctomycetaceae bacterium]|nr:hypothetical protein [Planctomycetaceae bacterium]